MDLLIVDINDLDNEEHQEYQILESKISGLLFLIFQDNFEYNEIF
jgi:hypothetical protein